MDWLLELFEPNNLSLPSTIILYSVVIFTGIYLGKIKIFGVSLGCLLYTSDAADEL